MGAAGAVLVHRNFVLFSLQWHDDPEPCLLANGFTWSSAGAITLSCASTPCFVTHDINCSPSCSSLRVEAWPNRHSKITWGHPHPLKQQPSTTDLVATSDNITDGRDDGFIKWEVGLMFVPGFVIVATG